MPIIRLLRTPQYIKNIFIFAPLIFSFQFNTDNFINTSIIFILFSLLASSIYIFNDLMDINEDRKHPKKKFRPLANNQVSIKIAKILIISLSTISLFYSFLININLFYILLIYFLLNILYSIKLKHIPIVDIFIIAIGFVLRLFAGNSIFDTTLSMWLIIMTFLLALFLAIAKRRDDIILSNKGKETRKNIDGYNLELVNSIMVLMAGIIIVSYIMYTVSIDVITRLNSNYLYITTVFVILGLMRYMQITFVEENSESPTEVLYTDNFLQITIILWLLSFFLIVKGIPFG